MRIRLLVAILLIASFGSSEEDKLPLLVSIDKIDMFGHDESSLRVFPDGQVIYLKGQDLNDDKRLRRYESSLDAEGMQRLVILLNSKAIRSLPKRIGPKIRPIDFFWQKSLEVNRADGTQAIEIENFYPFLNRYESAYPPALIELECEIEEISEKAAKRPKPDKKDDWCHDLLKKP